MIKPLKTEVKGDFCEPTVLLGFLPQGECYLPREENILHGSISPLSVIFLVLFSAGGKPTLPVA